MRIFYAKFIYQSTKPMKNQENCLDVKKFLEWRVQLYNALDSRRETVMELRLCPLIESTSSNGL